MAENGGSGEEFALAITRVFDAPRELVWKAWTDPALMRQWRGPGNFVVSECVTSAEVGGPCLLTMSGSRFADGEQVTLRQVGRTLEFDPPKRLVYTFAWVDRAAVGLAESPIAENVVTVTFEEHDGKTWMQFRQTPFATEGERDGHDGGWNRGFDKLAEFLLAEQPGRAASPDVAELRLQRFFAVPRELVFRAWTDPKVLAQWWGPKGFTNPVCEMDARAGGEILIHMQAADGTVYPMSGQIVEIVRPERIVFSSAALDGKGNAMFRVHNTVTFRAVEGGTELSVDLRVLEQTAPQSQQHLKGMETGWLMSLDKLNALMTTTEEIGR